MDCANKKYIWTKEGGGGDVLYFLQRLCTEYVCLPCLWLVSVLTGLWMAKGWLRALGHHGSLQFSSLAYILYNQTESKHLQPAYFIYNVPWQCIRNGCILHLGRLFESLDILTLLSLVTWKKCEIDNIIWDRLYSNWWNMIYRLAW